MTDSGVRTERRSGKVTVILDRPARKNAMTPAGWAALRDAAASVDPARDRVLVLTGATDDFCAGADLAGALEPGKTPYEGMRLVNAAVLALHQAPIPTIARVDGAAVGAGMSLALACDMIVASERARFSQIFIKRALSPDTGGSWLLPRAIGLAKAKELAMLGDMVSAERAAEVGFVHRVVPPGKLDQAVDDLATRLGNGPTIALGLTKDLLNDSFDVTLAQALDAEAKALAINVTTNDAREASLAFRDKRDPDFTGR